MSDSVNVTPNVTIYSLFVFSESDLRMNGTVFATLFCNFSALANETLSCR